MVEPEVYAPAGHAALFTAVIGKMVLPEVTGLQQEAVPLPEALDLMVWPEAFLPQETLLAVLGQFLEYELAEFPCVHVGLRPDGGEDGGHLFTVGALRALTGQIRALSHGLAVELDAFNRWLNTVPENGRYNIACLFLIDAEGQLRVCLHPKNTASGMEIGALPETNVTEADFIAVVSLTAADPAIFTVHIQPVICSDYLELNRQTNGPGPLAAFSADPGRIGPNPPEHIDIVSAVTCTHHRDQAAGGLPPVLNWHGQFRQTMVNMARSGAYPRHRSAITLLANSRRIFDKPAGLSGLFAPLPLPAEPGFPEFNRVWSWGRQDRADDEWRRLDGQPPKGWSSRGHLVSLTAETLHHADAAYAMTFTLPYLPRDRGLWDGVAAVAEIQAHAILVAPSPSEAQADD